MEESIVGDLITFRGLVYAPINEQGVVFLFGKIVHDLNMYVEEIKIKHPDCIARRFTGKGWERIRIEFEFISSNYKAHGHDHKECDMIVCWEHDWPECPLEVIELKSAIKDLKNPPITHPQTIELTEEKGKEKIEAIRRSVGAGKNVIQWYTDIFEALRKVDERIWANPREIYIGLYCPEKSFASIKISKTSIQIECFSGDAPIKGTKASSVRFSPRWSKFSIKNDKDAKDAIGKLTESYHRIKDAIKKGEATSYYSGGEYCSESPDSDTDSADSDEEEDS